MLQRNLQAHETTVAFTKGNKMEEQNNTKTQQKEPGNTEKIFVYFADSISNIASSPYWFGFSVLLVVGWALSGFLIGFGESWQLMINTTTTVLTFLMISLLHSSQRRWEEMMKKMQDIEVRSLKEIQDETKTIVEETIKTSGNDSVSTEN